MTPDTVFWRRKERDDILKEVIKASQEVDRVALVYGELYEFLGDRRDKHSRAAMDSIGDRLTKAQEELDILFSRLSDAHRAVVLARAELPADQIAAN
ncbi:hypothetical protein [Bradyrhizobium elkanii]|uniref:DUF47 family protein n=1 Tax=Bradyrhizobium elkanii TaxID=29448 RepID=A0ABV4F0C1_BRAEL|nr:hypothetical protein [Bradyrhizobium elkanii]MCP1757881.1 hypothetical protein [Bradyrhizobium elkanii]MCS3881822.1 hypothetical protein [Bradyrhizobium elkanii]MCS4218581.1 hypothetical protein [Bradyrhizobium elkanii]MCW2110122.1 hypothetical protein [Bradyrhizobium elkanii]MCW2201509.1 hypothetical protein [Bradyrhizobium elkanii]